MRYFPPNIKAQQATLLEQVGKVIEEFGEVIDAVMKARRLDVAEECLDLIQATEGLIDKVMRDEEERESMRVAVIEKCNGRGDYGRQMYETDRGLDEVTVSEEQRIVDDHATMISLAAERKLREWGC